MFALYSKHKKSVNLGFSTYIGPPSKNLNPGPKLPSYATGCKLNNIGLARGGRHFFKLHNFFQMLMTSFEAKENTQRVMSLLQLEIYSTMLTSLHFPSKNIA